MSPELWLALPLAQRAAELSLAGFGAILLLFDGCTMLLFPARRLARMALSASDEGLTDLRATYGSAHFGFALLLLVSLATPGLRPLSAPLLAAILVVVTVCRAVAIRIERPVAGLNRKILMIEGLGAALLLGLLLGRALF